MPYDYSSSAFTEVVVAKGHPNVLATHPTTFEVTKEDHLTRRGDCVLAVSADKGARDLTPKVREALMRSCAKTTVEISISDKKFVAQGFGHERLCLAHPTDMVFRKSTYVSDRTVMIASDKAARDVPRDMVALLSDPRNIVKMTITVLFPQLSINNKKGNFQTNDRLLS